MINEKQRVLMATVHAFKRAWWNAVFAQNVAILFFVYLFIEFNDRTKELWTPVRFQRPYKTAAAVWTPRYAFLL